MYTLIPAENLTTLPSGTVKFEGAPYGSGASFFRVSVAPGSGSALHKHPYPETWIVYAGNVRFTVGSQDIVVSSGDVVVAAQDIPHKFLNVGTERLHMICIHPSPRIIQELVAE